jgi:hypothetical protein
MDVADGGATENGDALKPAPFSAVPGRRHNRCAARTCTPLP